MQLYGFASFWLTLIRFFVLNYVKSCFVNSEKINNKNNEINNNQSQKFPGKTFLLDLNKQFPKVSLLL